MKLFYTLLLLLMTVIAMAGQVGTHHDDYNHGWSTVIDLTQEIVIDDSILHFGNVTFSAGYQLRPDGRYDYFIQSNDYGGNINPAVGNGLGKKYIKSLVELPDNNPAIKMKRVYQFSNYQSTLIVALAEDTFVDVYHLDMDLNELDNITFDFSNMINQYDGRVDVKNVEVFKDQNDFPHAAITTEVYRNNLGESDFGLIVVDVNPLNDITYMTGFGARGRALCAHDHTSNPNFIYSPDSPGATAFIPSSQSLVIAGTAKDHDGTNMGFCQFDLSGALIAKWSTQDEFIFQSHQEWAHDILVDDSGNTPQLYVAGAISGAGGLDFTVTKYIKNQISQWVIDRSFGSNGFATLGFQSFDGNAETKDIAKFIKQQANGHFVVAGDSHWTQNTHDLSHIRLTSFDENGQHLQPWGESDGQASPFWKNDTLNGFPKEHLTQLILNANDDMLISGHATGDNNGTDWRIGLLGKLYNDPIFATSFD